MPSISLTTDQAAFLDRTARSLSEKVGRKVSRRDVLSLLIEVAIEDEAVYDIESGGPLSPYKKRISQAQRRSRTASFDVGALVEACKG